MAYTQGRKFENAQNAKNLCAGVYQPRSRSLAATSYGDLGIRPRAWRLMGDCHKKATHKDECSGHAPPFGRWISFPTVQVQSRSAVIARNERDGTVHERTFSSCPLRAAGIRARPYTLPETVCCVPCKLSIPAS
jgi:hypothetical protein